MLNTSKYFIKLSESRLVAVDHIVDVQYRPAQTISDEDGTFHAPAEMTVVLDSLVTETETEWDGKVIGVASKSERVFISGEEADRLWKTFMELLAVW